MQNLITNSEEPISSHEYLEINRVFDETMKRETRLNLDIGALSDDLCEKICDFSKEGYTKRSFHFYYFCSRLLVDILSKDEKARNLTLENVQTVLKANWFERKTEILYKEASNKLIVGDKPISYFRKFSDGIKQKIAAIFMRKRTAIENKVPTFEPEMPENKQEINNKKIKIEESEPEEEEEEETCSYEYPCGFYQCPNHPPESDDESDEESC